MGDHLPLPTLLSHALVAFTIEFDNEFERVIRHRTTRHGTTQHGTTQPGMTGAGEAGTARGPWLVSLVMWSNCMRFVTEAGVSVRDLERVARTKTNLPGMERWGYVEVEPDPADPRPKPPRSAWLARPTRAGRKAQEIWPRLFGVIEERWQTRYGKQTIQRLRASLWAVAGRFEIELPDCLPILGYGLFSRDGEYERRPSPGQDDEGARLSLVAMLSRVLLAFAIEFEGESDLSLAISANVVRVLNEEGVRVRDLPLLSGVSKEAIAVALAFLTKRGYATVEGDASRAKTAAAKVAHLTAKGLKAQEKYRELLGRIEERWTKRFGKNTIRELSDSLQQLVGEPTAQESPLLHGLEPYPDGWRASVRRPPTLPHYPMVLHRGGYPDGS